MKYGQAIEAVVTDIKPAIMRVAGEHCSNACKALGVNLASSPTRHRFGFQK